MNYRSIKWLDNIIYHPLFPITWIIIAIHSVIYFDKPIATYFHDHADGPLFWAAESLTDMGEGEFYLIAFGIFLLISFFLLRHKLLTRTLLYLILCIVIPGIIVDILKVTFSRARPIELFDHGIYGLHFFRMDANFISFPSGHASTITGVTLGLGYLYPKLLIPLLSIAVIICCTRLVVFAHYLSDIMSGALIATLCVPMIHRMMFQNLDKTT